MVAYDGTNYAGFQIQPNDRTVQGEIERALSVIFKQEIRINYAGRTDSRVHAFGQVIDFSLPFFIDNESLKKALNSLLDKDIRILKVFSVSDDFHSRYLAKAREYLYFIFTGEVLPPFLRNYVWHRRDVNVEKIRQMTHLFVGRRDFRFVANEPNDKNCVREVHFFRVKRIRNFVVFHVRANAFLRGMVRNMVGLSVFFSSNDLQKDSAGNIIFEDVPYFKAPANGLFLRRVIY
nr:tRNA pseudouridine(38-40) synthase TruA [Hippea alviniae]